jgi:hypothetical protein
MVCLRQQGQPVVAGDVAQLARDRGDVVCLRRVHHAEVVAELNAHAGEAPQPRISEHIPAILVFKHDHQDVIEGAAAC